MLVAKATSEGIKMIATSINQPGGSDAVNLRVAEQYIKEFGNLAKINNTMIIPQSLSDVSGLIATATSIVDGAKAAKKKIETKRDGDLTDLKL
jgi:hypothetical protein